MRFHEIARVTMALCLPLVPATEAITVPKNQKTKFPVDEVSNTHCAKLGILHDEHSIGCRPAYLDSAVSAYGSNQVGSLGKASSVTARNVAATAIVVTFVSGAPHSTESLSTLPAPPADTDKGVLGEIGTSDGPWSTTTMASKPTLQDQMSHSLPLVNVGEDVAMIGMGHLNIAQEQDNRVSTLPPSTEPVSKRRINRIDQDLRDPLNSANIIGANMVKFARGVTTQGLSSTFTTMTPSTGEKPSWMKRQIRQGSTDRLITAPIPTPSRSACSKLMSTTPRTQGPFDTFSTVPLPTGPDPTWHKRQISQGTTDRFSTTPIPSPTRSACVEHSNPKTQGPSDLFSTISLPTGPDPTWHKRQHTQAGGDLFSTVPLWTGPEPTWKAEWHFLAGRDVDHGFHHHKVISMLDIVDS